jgi:hypothetical protein
MKMIINKRNQDDCNQPTGLFRPIVNRNRWEAKKICSAVCSFEIFEIRTLTQFEKYHLNSFTRLKVWAHGNKQAFPVRVMVVATVLRNVPKML